MIYITRPLAVFVSIFVLLAAAVQAQTIPYRPDRSGGAPALDVYSFDGAQNAPVMVYVHGGAWMIGDKRQVHDKPAFFNGLGMVFVSVNYDLVPASTVEGQLSDIDYALHWVSQNIGRYGGDPHNIHLFGHSAGAHLVSMTAVAPLPFAAQMIARGDIRSVVSNDTRAYDIPRIAREARGGRLPRLYVRPFGLDPTRWEALSPIYHLHANQRLPDFLLMYSSEGNSARRQAFAMDFADRLRASGAQVSLFDGRAYTHRQINVGVGNTAPISRAITRFLQGRL